MESWPLERSGFSAFVGTAINQPTDRDRLERVLRYIFRPSLPLKHLSYRESTGQVTYSQLGAVAKMWPHASDFLADWVQHVPRAKQHQVTYAGWFANALGKLNPKKVNADSPNLEVPKPKWVRWRALVLRTWAVDPELCPQCRKQMKRAKALFEKHELQRLLKNLGWDRPIPHSTPFSATPRTGPKHRRRFSLFRRSKPGPSRVGRTGCSLMTTQALLDRGIGSPDLPQFAVP